MRRSIRTITAIVFLGILVACGLAIVYLGTATGLTFGGGRTVTGATRVSTPMYAQLGWIRNTSPWPVTITRIRANAVHAAKPVSVYIERGYDPSAVNIGDEPIWTKTSGTLPYQLVGGQLRYLGFGLIPTNGEIAAFRSITITFTGPLGFTFDKTFDGTNMAAASATISSGLIAADPTHNPASLDAYLTSLRGSLGSRDPSTLTATMGSGTTAAQATAFLSSQAGYSASDKISSSIIGGSAKRVRVAFYATDPTKDALPAFTVVWSEYRWAIVR